MGEGSQIRLEFTENSCCEIAAIYNSSSLEPCRSISIPFIASGSHHAGAEGAGYWSQSHAHTAIRVFGLNNAQQGAPGTVPDPVLLGDMRARILMVQITGY